MSGPNMIACTASIRPIYAVKMYEHLEGLMLQLDDGEPDDVSNFIRDLMDHLWFAMSDDEQRALDNRGDLVHEPPTRPTEEERT